MKEVIFEIPKKTYDKWSTGDYPQRERTIDTKRPFKFTEEQLALVHPTHKESVKADAQIYLTLYAEGGNATLYAGTCRGAAEYTKDDIDWDKPVILEVLGEEVAIRLLPSLN